jgi:DNA polymerase III subunit beta
MTMTDIVAGSGMKVGVTREELVASLAVVARGVSTRTAVQILSGVHLRAEDGLLHLAATDMELSLRTSIPARIDATASVVVPGRLLAELSRLLPEGDVELEGGAEEAVLRVSCGSASYTLHTYSAEDFPRLPEVEAASLFSLDRDAFLDTASRVSRAASRDESRPVLTGILVQFEGGTLVMAATDSYRLAVKQTAVSAGTDLEALVPARALAEVQRLAPAADGLELGVLENQVVFELGGTTLTSRRIDGQFPNYKALLPDNFEYEVVLPRGELLDVVRRVAVMAQRNAPLRLRFGEGELTVTARTPDVGEATESLPAPYTGDPLEIGFNAEFLRDGIESVEGDDVRLKLISPLRPAVLQGTETDFTYLIMPIRLAG